MPDHVLIPPNSFALAATVEEFDIPRDVLAVCLGKSTYARCGIVVNVTPLEPEWRGAVTIEISNTTPLPAKIYAGEGIAQLVFLRSDERIKCVETAVARLLCPGSGVDEEFRQVCEREFHAGLRKASCGVSYADRKGRYQGQSGITLPKVGG